MTVSRQQKRWADKHRPGTVAFATYKPVVNKSKTYAPNGKREVARREMNSDALRIIETLS